MADASEDSVRALLDRINNAWLKGRPEDIPSALQDCFHERVTTLGPDFKTMVVGAEATIRSYQDFVQQASVRECTLSEPSISVAGDTAVAAYSWSMTYELNGTEYRESGHEFYVFNRTENRWLGVWRALLPGQG
jgi:ketosteroid isomerase-like protein